VQRRERVRPTPGKERATLFDMIIMPPELDRQSRATERVTAICEFAELTMLEKLEQNC